MRALPLAAALAACAHPPVPAPAALPAPPLPAPGPPPIAAYELPPPSVLPRFERVWRAGARAAGGVVYDFADQPLEPVRRGPRMAERSRAGRARTFKQLRDQLVARREGLVGCWKWAAARGAVATTIDLALTVDPFGATRDLALTSRDHHAPELIGCWQEQLAGLALASITPRTTRMFVALELTLADQRPWPRPPPRPPAPARPAPPSTACTPVVELPVDVVRAPLPITLSDADVSREPGHPVSLRMGCAHVASLPGKVEIRAAIAANAGAFRACYADALDRDPALAGTVALQVGFDPGGSAGSAQVAGPGDAAFHACLASAGAELWLQPAPARRVTINVPFVLAPRPAAAATRDPEQRLAAGDPDAALAAWLVALAHPASPLAACVGRAGVARALAASRPWLDDDQLAAALGLAVTAIAALPPADAARCLAPLEPVLEQVALPGPGGAPGAALQVVWSWLERHELALPIADRVSWGNQLHRRHAEALLLSERRAEGIAELRALAEDPALGEEAAARATRAAQAIDVLADDCDDRLP